MQEILGGVVAIIAIAITIGIGSTILGSSSSAFNCQNLQGYNSTSQTYATGSWAATCRDAQAQTTQAWTLIPIILIVIVAAIIITVLRGFYGSTG
ncbi:MAG: hypothetical protein MPK62_00240 [Alphaproteobacteria bacterium]|nr:hypothetical protein [Alphaproteobacteria bacterium]MDA8029566.1 hypothetical protein [Alphaproteobacteria bacterium]